jgi:predicted outer membrane repeat protein
VINTRWGRRWPGIAFAIGLGAVAGPVRANTFTVINTSDSGPGSLRAAIAGALNGDTINFNLAYPATIVLNNSINFTSSLNISGPGAASLTINANASPQVFSISAPSAVLSGLTIGNGGASCCGRTISNSGTLTINSSAISAGAGATGGGIDNLGTLILNNTTLSGSGDGGIYSAGGSVILTNSTLSGNSSIGGIGGGIYVLGGSLTVTNSTISGNSADFGGGIYSGNATVTVTNSTIAGNSAAWAGGAIDNEGGTLTLTFSTVWGNSAIVNGGGIYSSGTVKLKNTIVAGSGAAGNCYAFPPVSLGHNLSDDNSCGLAARATAPAPRPAWIRRGSTITEAPLRPSRC